MNPIVGNKTEFQPSDSGGFLNKAGFDTITFIGLLSIAFSFSFFFLLGDRSNKKESKRNLKRHLASELMLGTVFILITMHPLICFEGFLEFTLIHRMPKMRILSKLLNQERIDSYTRT